MAPGKQRSVVVVGGSQNICLLDNCYVKSVGQDSSN